MNSPSDLPSIPYCGGEITDVRAVADKQSREREIREILRGVIEANTLQRGITSMTADGDKWVIQFKTLIGLPAHNETSMPDWNAAVKRFVEGA